ncbi:glycine C-acetyltransferase [bacterium A37T11]|nr:glycine C-acetyltransferase [bacterium A37T11]
MENQKTPHSDSRKRIDFSKASFKDFRDIENMDALERAAYFQEYLDYLAGKGQLNYRLESLDGCGPEMRLKLPGQNTYTPCVCFVSNDYLGFTQHPLVKAAGKQAIDQYGSGAGASPAIGGHFNYHQMLEEHTATFYKKTDSLLYTTGYTANSATLQCLLGPKDIAIVDMAVHASVYEGIRGIPVKRFLHNNLQHLEQALDHGRRNHRTRMVVIDGVYSQDGDQAPLKDICNLAHHYGAYVFLDDAHGVGVVGETGRGVIEAQCSMAGVDIIMGTYSKALGHRGGYIVADRELINLLKYQSEQHLFSTADGPTILGIVQAMQLIDQEPQWRHKLWDNIHYLKLGLQSLGLNIGTTDSAIIPIKIGDIPKTLEAGNQLLKAGIYTNPIMYPAVSKKDARIRLNITARHTLRHLDTLLNVLEDVRKKIGF